MFKVGDKVKFVRNTHKGIWRFRDEIPVGSEGFVIHDETNNGDCCVLVQFDGDTWNYSVDELQLVSQKYLVYNATSHKSVGIMTMDSALRLAKSTPQCEFQVYELKYNIVPKPVDVQYEAVEA